MPPAPSSRPTTAPGAGRLSLGGGARSRPGSAPGGRGAAAAPPGKEESFSLSSSSVLDFGAIIRLTPDFIEEITRVESEGGSAKIKFAPNSNIPNGNVINVAGKEFGFTWSRDELCDIYEEHRSGEGGDGLLVERGSAWRKMNVHRILDESTKKHVKKRSEEAERLLKSRKAIVLDPSNPSMKNHVKKMAAAEVEGNMRRMNWKQKKEPFYKKQKVESNQVSNLCPPKSIYKPGTSSNKTGKPMLTASPLSTPPEQPAPVSVVSPFATGISSRGDLNLEEITPPLDINKEHIDIRTFEEEMPSRSAHGSKHKVAGHKGHTGDQAIDFQSNRAQRASTNGLKLKLLDKAVGETIPNPTKKNDNTIRNNEAPGKQLKSGMEVESSSRREFEIGSSPESSHDIASAIESIFGEKITDEKLVDEEEPFERIEIMQDNPVPFNNADRKGSNDNEGKSSSSESGSGSDSDSDGSGSGSDSDRSRSRSHSKSRSPVGSASASSSDSESDGSSSSKEASDVDVDIMASEDEKEVGEPKKLSSLQIEMVSPVDGEHEHIDILGDQEEQTGSFPIDLNNFGRDDDMANPINDAKDFPSNNSVKTSEKPEINFSANIGSSSYRTDSRFPLEDPFSSDQYNRLEDPQLQIVRSPKLTNGRVTSKVFNEIQPSFNDWSSHEKTETSKKMKPKRASGSEFFNEKIESTKRSKGARAAEVMPFGKSKDVLPVNTHYISPENARNDQYISNNTDNIKDMDSQDYSLADHSRSVAFGNTRKIQHSPEFWSSSSLDAEQPGPRISDISAKWKSVDRFNKITERMPVRADAIPKDKAFDVTNFGEKHSFCPDFNRKSGDGPPSQMKKSHGDKSPVLMGKGSVLRRELSELELGELRELPAGGEAGGVERQSEGKFSSKPQENKGASTHSLNQGNQEGFYRKMPQDDPVDTARVLQRTMPSQSQQPSRVDVTDSEIKSHAGNSAELVRGGQTRTNHAGSLRKTSTSLTRQNDIKHGGQKGYKSVRESKQQKLSILRDIPNQSKNGVSMENETNGRKRRESSTEDDNSFYSKYDKEVPELRNSINDFSQYNDYVQEYREKFDCYVSLNKNLEKIRNDFVKVGDELELAKRRGSEEYFRVVDQLREMYHQHGERNKQMKRVFLVLHEELKTLKQRICDFAEMHTRE